MTDYIKMRQALGRTVFLIVGLIGLLSVDTKNQLILFLAIWSLTLLMVVVVHLNHPNQLFTRIMYVLVMTTFLNQSVLSIQFGFFSLFLYRLVLILSVISFLVFVVKEKNLYNYWEQIKVKNIVFFLLFWVIYGAVSLLWAKAFVDGIKYLLLLGTGILFVYLALFAFKSFSRLFVFYGIWMFMTFILIIIGLFNHFAHVQLPSSTLYGASDYKLAYPTAVFFNQNDFATFLSISFFFYLAAAKNSRETWVKTSALILSGLCVYLIFLTDSRASLLGVGVGVVVYGFIYLPRSFKKILLVLGIISFFGGAILFFIKFSSIYFFLHPGSNSLSSNSIRLNLLKNGLHFFLKSFGLGVGSGNIPYYLKNEAIYPTNQVIELHNWLAEILVNFGVFIFLGYLLMYGYLFITLYKSLNLEGTVKQRTIIEACLMGLAAFLISSISPSSVSNLYFHWVFLGYVTAAVNVVKMAKPELQSKILQMRQVEYGISHS